MRRLDITCVVGFTGAVVGVASAGCSSGAVAESEEVPGVEVDTAEANQVVTTVNGDGTWTANALAPNLYQPVGLYNIEGYGRATFTGPAGKTRKMGVCAIKQSKTSAGAYKTCTTDTDCAASPAAPSTLPTGGYRYCTAPNGSGQKYCFHRPGPETSYCAGTPANGYQPIAPGTYNTPVFGASGPANNVPWISYACFEQCLFSDPSSSSASVVPPKLCQNWCGSTCCK